jgi:hypothetical protein
MRSRVRNPKYRLHATRAGVRLDFLDEHFFDNRIIDEKGTTALDHHIAAVVQEIRAALYYLATDGTKH